MCAIIGMCGNVSDGRWSETHRLLGALFVAAEHRGRDATGFVAGTVPAKRPQARQVVTAKRPIPPSQFVQCDPAWLALRHRRCSAVVGHCRLATHGSPVEPKNNHPHSGGGFHVAHNGILNDHKVVAERNGLKLRGQCDSEVLLRLVQHVGHPIHGLRDCLRQCQGTMAVALYDERRNVVLLARNSGRPLWVARLPGDGRTFFASTLEILLAAFRSALGPFAVADFGLLMPLAENVVHALLPDGHIIASGA